MPPEPIGPVIAEALTSLIPEEITLEVFNSEYLQQYPANAKVILASAKVSHQLQAPRTEVEDAIFGILNPEVSLDIKVSGQISFPSFCLLLIHSCPDCP